MQKTYVHLRPTDSTPSTGTELRVGQRGVPLPTKCHQRAALLLLARTPAASHINHHPQHSHQFLITINNAPLTRPTSQPPSQMDAGALSVPGLLCAVLLKRCPLRGRKPTTQKTFFNLYRPSQPYRNLDPDLFLNRRNRQLIAITVRSESLFF